MTAGAAALAIARFLAATGYHCEFIRAALAEYAATLPGWLTDRAALNAIADAANDEEEARRAEVARALAPAAARAMAKHLAASGCTQDQVVEQLFEMAVVIPHWLADLEQINAIAGEAFHACAQAARGS